jgi:hypothetical protein
MIRLVRYFAFQVRMRFAAWELERLIRAAMRERERERRS